MNKCSRCGDAIDDDFHKEICPEGRFNKSADLVKRKNITWSDTNLLDDFSEKNNNEDFFFGRLICRNCNSLSFEVLITDEYETSARCIKCGMYYKVHCG
jgi:hypothetical protein